MELVSLKRTNPLPGHKATNIKVSRDMVDAFKKKGWVEETESKTTSTKTEDKVSESEVTVEKTESKDEEKRTYKSRKSE